MLDETELPVTLAGKKFVVQQVPMARVRRLSRTIAEITADLDIEQMTDAESVGAFVEKLLKAPHAVLSLFIEDLPESIFSDEQHGVTFPELLEALNKCVYLNRLDALKNGLSRLIPIVLQAQASTSPTRS